MERLNAALSTEQLESLLGGTGGKKEPKLPFCLTCHDLGNYEMALMSDRTEKVKWIYQGKYKTELDNKRTLIDVTIQDGAKGYIAMNPGVTEVTTYRLQCPTCHPKFVAKHNEQAAIVKNKDFDETTRALARAELQKIWGLTITGKR